MAARRVILASVLMALLTSPAAVAVDGHTDRLSLEIVVKPREPRPDVFFLAGRVKPEYAKQEAVLQRRNCGSCAWFAAERFETDGESRFRLEIPDLEPGQHQKVCYRVKIPRSAEVKKAISESNCVAPIDTTSLVE